MVSTAVSSSPVSRTLGAPEQSGESELRATDGPSLNRSEHHAALRQTSSAQGSTPAHSRSSENSPPESAHASEQPAVIQDPRVVASHQLISDFQTQEVRRAEDLLSGSRSNLESTRRDIENTGFFDWASGGLKGMRETEAVEQQLVERREAHRERLVQAQREAQQHLEEAIKLETQARDLERSGNGSQAQQLRDQAQLSFNRVSETISAASESRITTTDISRGLSSANDTLSRASTRLDRTETALRITRDTAVIVGATVATGGVAGAAAAAGYGTIAAGGIALAAGTATGTGIGAVANYTEAGGHVLRGNMSADDALSRANSQTLQDLRTSAIASASTVAATGAAAGVVGRMGTTLTGRTVAGAAAGATGATTSTVANTSINYAQAVQDFNQQYADVALAQREQLYTAFMRERQLGADQIAWNSAINITTGTLSGGIGGHSGAVREAAQSTRQALLLEGREAAATAAVGLSMSYVRDGKLTSESIAQELQGAAVGFAQGRLSTPRGSIRPDDSAPSPSSKVEPQGSPRSAIDTYLDQNGEGARVSGNGRAIYLDSVQKVQDAYAHARADELMQGPARLPQAEADSIARGEAASVKAFYDQQSGRMVLGKLDPSADPASRLIHSSFVKHEVAHARGLGEVDAWMKQGEYLANKDLGDRRMRLDLSGDQPVFRPFRPGDSTDVLTRSEVEGFVNRGYRSDSGSQYDRAVTRIDPATGSSTYKRQVAEYYSTRSDAELQSLQKWVENSSAINRLMANYPEIAVPLAQRDYAAMFDNTVIIAERLPLVEQDAFINNVTTAYRLMNLEPVAISPSRESFLFRGQNSRNQIIAGPEGQVNSSTFLATSRQPEGATMYSRDNTDTLAVFLSPDRTIE